MEAKNRIIIDTDAGIDDIVSIFMILQDKNSQVDAFTIVDGNVSLERAVENIQFVNNLVNSRILKHPDVPPIYKGCSLPILPNVFKKKCWSGHGHDGIGSFSSSEFFKELQINSPLKSQNVPDEHAANAFIRMVRESPKEIQILALGPLTNIALAISIDPLFLTFVKSVVLMGGSYHSKGNSSRSAEFNFHCDPEAVHILLDASNRLNADSPVVKIVPWETCLDNSLSWKFYDDLTSYSNPLSRTLKGICALFENMIRNDKTPASTECNHQFDQYTSSMESFLLPDIYASMVLLNPHSVKSFKNTHIEVELSGKHTRGTLLLDWNSNETKSNATIVLSIDVDSLKKSMISTFCD